MNIVDRLKIFMQHTGMPISQFADSALIPRPTLSQILSGRNKKISNEILEKLHDAFPNLNVSWLLFGDGEMLRNGFENSVSNSGQETQNLKPVPQQQQTASETAIPFIPGTSGNTPIIPPADENTLSHSTKDVPKEKNTNPQIALAPDTNKKIQTIMVFYTDNSFEIFTPSQR